MPPKENNPPRMKNSKKKEENQIGRHKVHSDKIGQVTVQAISASQVAE